MKFLIYAVCAVGVVAMRVPSSSQEPSNETADVPQVARPRVPQRRSTAVSVGAASTGRQGSRPSMMSRMFAESGGVVVPSDGTADGPGVSGPELTESRSMPVSGGRTTTVRLCTKKMGERFSGGPSAAVADGTADGPQMSRIDEEPESSTVSVSDGPSSTVSLGARRSMSSRLSTRQSAAVADETGDRPEVLQTDAPESSSPMVLEGQTVPLRSGSFMSHRIGQGYEPPSSGASPFHTHPRVRVQHGGKPGGSALQRKAWAEEEERRYALAEVKEARRVQEHQDEKAAQELEESQQTLDQAAELEPHRHTLRLQNKQPHPIPKEYRNPPPALPAEQEYAIPIPELGQLRKDHFELHQSIETLLLETFQQIREQHQSDADDEHLIMECRIPSKLKKYGELGKQARNLLAWSDHYKKIIAEIHARLPTVHAGPDVRLSGRKPAASSSPEADAPAEVAKVFE